LHGISKSQKVDTAISQISDVHHQIQTLCSRLTWSQHKGCPVPPEVAKHLSVAQELAEVNVEEVSGLQNEEIHFEV
jgi:hypothetical protein